MDKLENKITINEEVIRATNLTDRFSDEDLDCIGSWMDDQYQRDLTSRDRWLKRTEAAMDLAMQVQKDKTFPWPNCSNVVFPLVTIAAMQFHARAYPVIVNGRNVVGCRVIGPDPKGVEKERAKKVADYMSYQLLEEDSCWEEDTDRGLLNTAIIGCGFKKTYRKGGKNISEFVQARDLVVDYFAKSIEDAQFKTHVFEMSRNDIYERVMRGQFRNVLEDKWFQSDAVIPLTRDRSEVDDRTGMHVPSSDHSTPFTLREHHCWLDLDQDGYEEPYIVTTEDDSNTVLRIVARFERKEDVERNSRNQIISISPSEYFTKIPFIPSPDGSIYDVGFGVLLGPLNESVNTAINQLFDAGTLANTAGGFLGRGAKIRGGVYEFRPFGWNRVDSSGDDLRKNIMPLPVREPNAVMFQLLSLIIDYTNRISGATDMLSGVNPGQNTPAETSRAMVEQGQKIYSAIFKRIWRSMKWEFKKLYVLNGLYLESSLSYGDAGGTISREDFLGSSTGLVPAADPNITSDAAKFAQAQIIKEASVGNPGYDADEVERTFLRALNVDAIDVIYPGLEAAGDPGPSEKVQIQMLKNEAANAKMELDRWRYGVQLQQQQVLNNAKIQQLEAQAMNLMKTAQLSEQDLQIQAFRAAIEALREQNKSADSQIKQLMELGNNVATGLGNAGSGGIQGMVSPSANPSIESMGQI